MAKSTDQKKNARPEPTETPPETTVADTAADKAAEQQEQLPEQVILTKEEFEKVKAHIEALQKDKEEAVGLAQRLQADFDNYRKRNSTLKKDSYDEGTRDCIRALLPTLDNFDRALSSTEGVDEAYVEGIRLVYRTLLDALEKLGFKEIDAGGMFDANLHNAVMQEAAEGKASGEILEVLQKGYAVGDKILRYSMVKVAE